MTNRLILLALLVAFITAEADAQNRRYRRRGALFGGVAGAAIGAAIGENRGRAPRSEVTTAARSLVSLLADVDQRLVREELEVLPGTAWETHPSKEESDATLKSPRCAIGWANHWGTSKSRISWRTGG